MAAIPDPAATAFLVVFSYATAWGRRWREWEGDEHVHSDDSPVGIHPHTSPAHALPQDAARTRHDVAAPPSPLCAFHATRIQVCCSCIALVQGTRHDATLPFAHCHGAQHNVVSPLVPLLARDTMSPLPSAEVQWRKRRAIAPWYTSFKWTTSLATGNILLDGDLPDW